ncbi:hypothetical protein [Allopusillimonas ginsengisoli]|uniref:hypothetical protein n=1 Tax=Allopusillimonas ginsengisoli TaxID=453575 RepID=UPI001020F356|nr:hypothetical protein [Allopusillimonas ginsengisoli]TEA79623.1 hypothetical protein ERE07_01355 [Allopusillimonas ginsengisoli]
MSDRRQKPNSKAKAPEQGSASRHGSAERPTHADKYDESYSHPRQPQGDDAEVDQRNYGRGNQFGRAGDYGQAHEENDKRRVAPEKPGAEKPDTKKPDTK